jgi:hypothetical protein
MARNSDEPKAKAANDAYTGMLAVSLIALLVGCGILYMDYSKYQTDKPGAPPKMDYTPGNRPPHDNIERAPRAQPDADEDKDKKDAPDKQGH